MPTGEIRVQLTNGQLFHFATQLESGRVGFEDRFLLRPRPESAHILLFRVFGWILTDQTRPESGLRKLSIIRRVGFRRSATSSLWRESTVFCVFQLYVSNNR